MSHPEETGLFATFFGEVGHTVRNAQDSIVEVVTGAQDTFSGVVTGYQDTVGDIAEDVAQTAQTGLEQPAKFAEKSTESFTAGFDTIKWIGLAAIGGLVADQALNNGKALKSITG